MARNLAPTPSRIQAAGQTECGHAYQRHFARADLGHRGEGGGEVDVRRVVGVQRDVAGIQIRQVDRLGDMAADCSSEIDRLLSFECKRMVLLEVVIEGISAALMHPLPVGNSRSAVRRTRMPGDFRRSSRSRACRVATSEGGRVASELPAERPAPSRVSAAWAKADKERRAAAGPWTERPHGAKRGATRSIRGTTSRRARGPDQSM